MRRIATRIAKLELRLLPPPPFEPGPGLLATLDRLIEHVRVKSGAEPTPESILEHLGGGRRMADAISRAEMN